MVFIVEVAVGTDDLPERMNEMREWLDHVRCAPSLFRFYRAGTQSSGCRVAFATQEEATAFARRFGGHVRDAMIAEAISEPSAAPP
jgi:hypothetical protein